MPKVSVVVPVYNGAEHLRKEAGGFLNQTLEDIEFIFVDDASTDDTWKVLQALNYMQPEKFKIIHSDRNRGAGGARNLGIENAAGEYIGFVDCDDSIAPTMYEKMYTEAKKGDFDMVECGYWDSTRKDIIKMFTLDYMVGEVTVASRIKWIVNGGYIVTKIFRRSLFENNERMRFRENVTVEDMDFLLYVWATVKTAGNVMEALYRYNDVSDSSSKAPDPGKYTESIYGFMKSAYERVHDLPVYDEISEAVDYFLIIHYIYGLKRCMAAIRNSGQRSAKEAARSRMRRLMSLKREVVKGDCLENQYLKGLLQPVDFQILHTAERGSVKQRLRNLENNFEVSFDIDKAAIVR